MANATMNPQMRQIIDSFIMLTASMANEVNMQTNGKYQLAVDDYITLVGDLNNIMARRIVPIKTMEEYNEEVRKYVTAHLNKFIPEEMKALADERAREATQQKLNNEVQHGSEDYSNEGI